MATALTVERYYDQTKAMRDIRSYHPDINIDLMQQAGMYSYYGTLLVKAESQHDRISNTIDVVAAKLDSDIRKDAAASGTKTTETQIKAAITMHANMRALVDALRQAREEVGYLKATCEALRQRKDALMQIAMMSREELKGSPVVMGKANRENRNERLKGLAKDTLIEFVEE